MNLFKKKINPTRIIVVFAAFIFLLKVIFILNTDHYFSGDAQSRLLNSYALDISGNLFVRFWEQFDLHWLSMFFWITRIPLELPGDLVLNSRIFHAAMGSFTLIPLYHLSKNLFPSSKNSLIVSVLFCFCIFHSIVSCYNLATSLFTFFATLCVWQYLQFVKGKSTSVFFLSSLYASFFIMNLIRFEGWIISFLLVSHILLILMKRKHWVVFAMSIFMFAMPLILYLIKSDFTLIGITFSDGEVEAVIRKYPRSLMYNFIFIQIGLPYFGLVTIPVSVILFFKNSRVLAMTLLAIWFSLVYKTFTGSLLPLYRYFIPVSIIALPYVAQFFSVISKRLTSPWKHLVFPLVVILTMIYQIYIFKKSSWYRMLYHQPGLKESALYARRNLPVNNLFVVDSCLRLYSEKSWLVIARNNKRECIIEPYYTEVRPGSSYRTFKDCITDKKVRYVVQFPCGNLHRFSTLFFEENPDYSMSEVFQSHGYQIFKINISN